MSLFSNSALPSPVDVDTHATTVPRVVYPTVPGRKYRLKIVQLAGNYRSTLVLTAAGHEGRYLTPCTSFWLTATSTSTVWTWTQQHYAEWQVTVQELTPLTGVCVDQLVPPTLLAEDRGFAVGPTWRLSRDDLIRSAAVAGALLEAYNWLPRDLARLVVQSAEP